MSSTSYVVESTPPTYVAADASQPVTLSNVAGETVAYGTTSAASDGTLTVGTSVDLEHGNYVKTSSGQARVVVFDTVPDTSLPPNAVTDDGNETITGDWTYTGTNDFTDATVIGISGGHEIQEAGVPLAAEDALNFVDLDVADNSGAGSTDVSLPTNLAYLDVEQTFTEKQSFDPEIPFPDSSFYQLGYHFNVYADNPEPGVDDGLAAIGARLNVTPAAPLTGFASVPALYTETIFASDENAEILLTGIECDVFSLGQGDVSYFLGLHTYMNFYGPGDITEAYYVADFTSTFMAGGNAPLFYGAAIKLNTYNDASVDEAYGIKVFAPDVADMSSIGEWYGLYVGLGSNADEEVGIEVEGDGLGLSLVGAYQDITERVDPSAPAANTARLYAKDVGGKTALFAIFNTGAAQQIAIEP